MIFHSRSLSCHRLLAIDQDVCSGNNLELSSQVLGSHQTNPQHDQPDVDILAMVNIDDNIFHSSSPSLKIMISSRPKQSTQLQECPHISYYSNIPNVVTKERASSAAYRWHNWIVLQVSHCFCSCVISTKQPRCLLP